MLGLRPCVVLVSALFGLAVLFTSTASAQNRYRTKGNYAGCLTKDDYSALVSYLVDRDRQAAGQMIADGSCVMLGPDLDVYIQDTGILSGVVQIRLAGSRAALWTALEAVTQASDAQSDPSSTPVLDTEPLVTAAHISYRLVKEEVHDLPRETQVVQRVLVARVPTEPELRLLLTTCAESLRVRTGFRFHPRPTYIAVLAYETMDKARLRGTLDLGRLLWHPDVAPPLIWINEQALASAGKSPLKRFGLTEQQRIQIFYELLRAQDRAFAEAERKHPAHNPEQTIVQDDFRVQLQQGYERGIARRYGVTPDILDSIADEADSRLWPPPKH